MDEYGLFNTFERALVDAVDFTKMDEEEDLHEVMKLFELSPGPCKDSVIADYKEIAAESLASIRKELDDFEKNIFSRRKPAFDHLEMLSHVAQGLSELHGKDVQRRDGQDNNATMAALAHLFPKSLLVLNEIICLLKGGFPDGALARWRTLHDLSVTAM